MARRENFNLSSGGHRAPIPNGCMVGNVFYSSAIGGRATGGGETPKDAAGQAHLMFQNMKTLVELAGGTTDDIVHVTLLLKDRSLREQVDPEWIAMFPDEHNRPARHAHQEDMTGDILMQCEIVAVIG